MSNQAYDDAAVAADQDTSSQNIVVDESSSPASTDSQIATEQTPTATDFNPELFSFEVNGQKVVPKDANQARMWLSGGYNFSQKQAEFKKSKAELDARSARVSELEKLNDAFEKNPDFQKKIMEWYTQSLTPKQQQMVDNGQVAQLPPEVLAKLERLDTLDQDVQRIKEKEEDQLLEQEINTLKSKYSDYDWNTDNGEGNLEMQVLKAAHDNGLTDLDKAFRLVTWDKVKINTEASLKKQMAEEKERNAKAGIVSYGVAQKPTPQAVDISSTPYNKLTEMAIAEMKG